MSPVRCHFWDILSVGVAWNVTQRRSRTSNHGRSRTVSRVSVSSLVLSDIIEVDPLVALSGKDVPFVWGPVCSNSFYNLRDSLLQTPILAFPTETGQYILDTDASNFGLGGVLSQIQDDVDDDVGRCVYVHTVPFLLTWHQIHPSN